MKTRSKARTRQGPGAAHGVLEEGVRETPQGLVGMGAVICPSGVMLKRLSIPLCKNISLHPSGKSSLQIRAIPPHKRGVSRSSRTRGGVRWTRQRQARNVTQGGFSGIRERSNGMLTNDVAAYGEVVWFWHPDAGVKFAEVSRPYRARTRP
jgi:hypothetical protein